ncbi:MAG: universal stress protein [Solirubrobacteraceae bacterium]
MRAWSILVGYDGSEHSDDALDFGQQLAMAVGAKLVVACVYLFQPLTGRLGSGDDAQRTLSGARLRVGAACETRMIPGSSVAEGLLRLADSEEAAIIVLGSRHRGNLGEALPGRTGKALLAGGRHLVAIVPRGHRGGPIARIGVLTDSSIAGRDALLAGEGLAAKTHAELRVHGRPAQAAAARQPSLADDLAHGTLDVLVAPAWPHGLLGRLRRSGRRARLFRAADCSLVIVPAGARLPAAPALAAGDEISPATPGRVP